MFAFTKRAVRTSPEKQSKEANLRQEEQKKKLELAKLTVFGPLSEVESLKRDIE